MFRDCGYSVNINRRRTTSLHYVTSMNSCMHFSLRVSVSVSVTLSLPPVPLVRDLTLSKGTTNFVVSKL
jgi:hypothetical protein